MDVFSANSTVLFTQLLISRVLPIFIANCSLLDENFGLENLSACNLRTDLLNNTEQLKVEFYEAAQQIIYEFFSDYLPKNESSETAEENGDNEDCDKMSKTMTIVHVCAALGVWLCLALSQRRKSFRLSRACFSRPSIIVPVDLVEYESSKLARYGYAACMIWTAILMIKLFDGDFLISPPFLKDDQFMKEYGFVFTLMGIVNAIFISFLTAPLFTTIYMRKLLMANILGVAISGLWLSESVMETTACSTLLLELLNSNETFPLNIEIWFKDNLALVFVSNIPIMLSCLLLIVIHLCCLAINVNKILADRNQTNVGDNGSGWLLLARMYRFVRPSRYASAVRYVRYLWQSKPAEETARGRRKANVAVDLSSVSTELDSAGGSKDLKSRVKSKVVGLVRYKRISGFKFSTRMICTMVASFSVLYIIGFYVILSLRSFFDEAVNLYRFEYLQGVVSELDFVFPANFSHAKRIALLKDCGYTIKYSFYVSVYSDLALHVVIMALMVVNYKRDIQAMYRGDMELLAIQEHMTASPANSVLASLRYAGTQIMFIMNSFVLNFLFLIVVCIVISFLLVLPLKHGIPSWAVDKLFQAIPPIVFSLILYYLQMFLTKFVFLTESGRWLALTNVRFFHLFSYLAFFLNCLVGLFSALRRVLFAVVIGLLNIGRLDRSTLPRTWEFLDTPHKMYIGCLRLEMVQNHPVLRCFVELLLKTRSTPTLHNTASNILSKRVRNRWLVAYTLAKNPELTLLRKRNLTKRYKLTTQGMVLVDVAQQQTSAATKSKPKSATESPESA